MSAEARRAARAEALARVAAAHRPLSAVFADLRGEPEVAQPAAAAVAVENAEPIEARGPEPQPSAADSVPAPMDLQDEYWRVASDALDAGRTARQRFGDPYCPAPVCYGRDHRVLDLEVLSAEGVPPYAADCNCSVIVD